MYKVDELRKYEFFKNQDLSHSLDSLTGVLSRQYIEKIAFYLISNNIPFAMAMIDLDNFKQINDTYGHSAGDLVLRIMGDDLINFVSDRGLVGRFGGDEFIIIYLKSNDYDSLHEFYSELYDGKVLRKSIELANNQIYLTATLGSASFPQNANTYDELFIKMDKAIYRGKIKGRNCFIIYVHEKHKDIIVKSRESDTLLNKLYKIDQLLSADNEHQLLTEIIDYLYRTLHPYNVFFINKDNYIWSGNNTLKYKYDGDLYSNLKNIIKNNKIFSTSSTQEIISNCPTYEKFILEKRIHALVIAKVDKFGYIVIYENAISRIWQDNDLALLFVASKGIVNKLYKLNNQK